MRKVRTQLDRLSAAPENQRRNAPGGPVPVGYNRHTDEIQRRIDAMSGNYPYQSPMMPYQQVPDPYAPHPPMMPMQQPHMMQPPMMQHPPMMQPQPIPMPVAVPQNTNNAELDNVKASLDRLTSKLQGISQDQANMSANRQGDAIAKETAMLGSHIAKLNTDMEWLKTAIVEVSAAASQQPDLNGFRDVINANYQTLAGQVERIASSDADPSVLAQAIEASHRELSTQIEEIKGSVGNLAADQTGDAAIGYFQDNIDELKTAISELSSHQQAPAVDFSPIESRLDEITRGLIAVSGSESNTGNLERIEARVSDISRTIAAISDHADSRSDGANVDASLQEVANGLVEIQNQLQDIPANSASVIDGLASQINKLSEKMDNLAAISVGSGETGSTASTDNSALLGRLDTLVDRVETLGSPVDQTSFLAIESQLDRINAGMETLRSQPVGDGQSAVAFDDGVSNKLFEHLEAISGQIQQLEQPAAGENADLLRSLEEQVASIAGQIGNSGGGEISLAPIEERLTGIEEQIGSSRDIAIEMASQVAEDAVKRTISELPATLDGESNVAANTLTSLAQDLQALNEQTQNANNNTNETFGSVKDTLAIIVERLNTIETSVANSANNGYMATPAPVMAAPQQASSEMPAAGGYDNQVAQSNEFEMAGAATAEHAASEEYSEHDPLQPMQDDDLPEHVRVRNQFDDFANSQNADVALDEYAAPNMETPLDQQPESDQEPVGQVSIEDDQPLDPGAKAPDLAALVHQANERRKGTDRRSGDSPVVPDFLAQARRAAQAANTEANLVEEEIEETTKQGLFAKLPQLLLKRKKVVLFAAAAVVMVALAVPLAGKFLGGNGTQQVVQQPAITQDVEPAAVEPKNSDTSDVSSAQVEAADDDQSVDAENNVVASGESQSSSDAMVTTTPANESADEATEQTVSTASDVQPATSTDQQLTTELAFATPALQQAVNEQDPAALFEIGRMYTDGIGVEKNLTEAARWYERAASLGFAPAQYRTGNFYEKGHGVEKDFAMASRWYDLAAESGNVVAMHNLAVLHAEGKVSGEPDFKEAFSWFKLAAEHGVRDSQVNIGILYTNGSGSEGQNLVEAYKWFAVAANAGDSDAASKRDVIANAMRPEQQEAARKAVIDWKAKVPEETSNSVNVPDAWKSDTSTKTAKISERDMIFNVQRMLAGLGFDPGPADGLMGQKTRNAIMAFQQRNGMPANGVVDLKLIKMLQSVST